MDLSYPGESSNPAFDCEELNGSSDSAITSDRLFESAYGDLFRVLPLDISSEQTDRPPAQSKKDVCEQPAKASQQNSGDLQGQVPDAYRKYLERYKDAGTTNRPASSVPEINPVSPAPKPEVTPGPKPKPGPAPAPQPCPKPG